MLLFVLVLPVGLESLYSHAQYNAWLIRGVDGLMNDTLPSATILLLSLDVTEKELVPGEMIKWLMPKRVLDQRLQTGRSLTSVGTR